MRGSRDHLSSVAASITVDAAGKIAAAAAAASEQQQQQQQSVEMNICVKQQSAISSLSQHHPSHQQQQPPPPNILPMVSSPRHIGQVAPNSDVGGLAAGSPRKRNAAVVVVHP